MSLKDIVLDLFGVHPSEPAARTAPSAPPTSRPSSPAGSSRTSARPQPRRSGVSASRGPRARDEAPSLLARSEAEVLGVVLRSGGGFRRVVFTRNRRVMASVAEGGAVLRLHAAFAEAPEAVLASVGVLFSTRDRRRRAAAREAVRAFVAAMPAVAVTPRPRARRVAPGDRAHLERLRAEFHAVNRESFGGALPSVPLWLSGRMRRRNGHFSARPLEIVISRRLCVRGAPGQAEQTLRHEMIHLWQHATGRPVDHGLEFRRMARALGVHPRATRIVEWRDGGD